MAEMRQLEFFLVRYVPDALREEFVNFGVLMLEPGANGGGYADVRFTRDWRRVRCLDPGADLGMLEALEADLRQQLARGGPDRDQIVAKLQDYCSNGVQFSSAKACLAADPAREMDTLAQLYLERRAVEKREAAGRQAIVGQLRQAFEQAGVWGLMRKRIAAAEYTRKGDPLKIDCGYRPNGMIRMFHAVSLATDADAAKVLAFSYPELQAGIARVEKATAELTAVVEDGLDRSEEGIAFALATLERNEIAVAGTEELAGIAERARIELRV